METIEERAQKYKVLNKLAVKGEAVVFGSDYLSDFPFYTLMQKRVSDYAVYNRSLESLTVKQAKSVVDDCLKYLAPSNILISFGENETANEEFLQDYDELIAKICKDYASAKVAVLQTVGSDDDFAAKVKEIAEKNGAMFIAVNPNAKDDMEVFAEMSSFFRRGKISFWDAFAAR